MVTILRRWALVVQGQEEGLAQLREGFAAWQQTGAQRQRPYYLTLLAEAHAQAGHPDEGFACLDEALASIYQTEERWWEAEGYRLKGQLTLQQQSKVQSLKSPAPST